MEKISINKVKLNFNQKEVPWSDVTLLLETFWHVYWMELFFPLTAQSHSLGVFLDLDLLLDGQVVAAFNNMFFQLWLVHQLHPFLEKRDLEKFEDQD